MNIQMRDNLAPSGSATEDAIANDPLTPREIEKQKADLAALKGIKELTPEFLTRFRKSAEYDLLDPGNGLK